MNQRNQKCQTCRFYKAEKALLTITRGKCHRFPPQYTFETRDDPSVFPVVVSSNWCGEWQPNNRR